MKSGFDGFSVFSDELWKIVGNCYVEPVDGTTSEVGARSAEKRKFV